MFNRLSFACPRPARSQRRPRPGSAYKLNSSPATPMMIEGASPGHEDSVKVHAATITSMPSTTYDMIWENLHFEDHIKRDLFDAAAASVLFSASEVNASGPV